MLGRLIAASRKSDPAAIVVVVSDHGFVELTHRVNLYIPFVQAGLIEARIDPATQAVSVSAWKAEPRPASGIARHRDLGQIDMRQVAPTVAALLGVKLGSATAPALLVRQ